jgi:hypothetical protein
VLVQPGHWFELEPPRPDAPSGYLVLGLLAEPAPFAEGAQALARGLGEVLR